MCVVLLLTPVNKGGVCNEMSLVWSESLKTRVAHVWGA